MKQVRWWTSCSSHFMIKSNFTLNLNIFWAVWVLGTWKELAILYKKIVKQMEITKPQWEQNWQIKNCDNMQLFLVFCKNVLFPYFMATFAEGKRLIFFMIMQEKFCQMSLYAFQFLRLKSWAVLFKRYIAYTKNRYNVRFFVFTKMFLKHFLLNVHKF